MSENEPTLETPAATQSASPYLASGIPFTFAQSRGVLLERSGSALTLYHLPPLSTEVLLEVRRFVGEAFTLEPLSE